MGRESDMHTQFTRCYRRLDIEIITTSVPQTKRRKEWLWGTIPSRLVSELPLNGIKNIDGANAFLPSFMENYNRGFAIKPNTVESLFAEPLPESVINYYLSMRKRHRLDNRSVLSLYDTRMQLVDHDGKTLALS